MDADRTGILPFIWEPTYGFERYTEYALDVPMYFRYDNGEYMDATAERTTFREFMDGRLPSAPGVWLHIRDSRHACAPWVSITGPDVQQHVGHLHLSLLCCGGAQQAQGCFAAGPSGLQGWRVAVRMADLKLCKAVLVMWSSSTCKFTSQSAWLLPGARPLLKDWEMHLTTIFPEVRLKRYMEMRGGDGGPPHMIAALPAFWVGLLYDRYGAGPVCCATGTVLMGQRWLLMCCRLELAGALVQSRNMQCTVACGAAQHRAADWAAAPSMTVCVCRPAERLLMVLSCVSAGGLAQVLCTAARHQSLEGLGLGCRPDQRCSSLAKAAGVCSQAVQLLGERPCWRVVTPP